jgi:hypothetical protein
METVLLILTVGTLNVVCFLIGVKVGQKVVKGEEVELPSLNPMKAYREAQDRKQAEREADRLDTIMQNIEAYDGTSAGQKDVM